MPSPAGLGALDESTFNTPVTVSKFYEYAKESITRKSVRVQSKSNRGDLVLDSSRDVNVVTGAAGDVEMDVYCKGFGFWLKHWLGQNTVTGASANKTHTCVQTNLLGRSMTLQVPRPMANAHQPFTYSGGKIIKGVLSGGVDLPLHFVASMDFGGEATATSHASPTYASDNDMLHFANATLSIDGTPIFARSFKLTTDPRLATNRRGIGNLYREQLPTDLSTIMVELDMDFDALTYVTAHRASTDMALTIFYEGPNVIPTTAVKPSLLVTLPLVRVTGTKENVDAPGKQQLVHPITLQAFEDGATAAITAVYTTADLAA